MYIYKQPPTFISTSDIFIFSIYSLTHSPSHLIINPNAIDTINKWHDEEEVHRYICICRYIYKYIYPTLQTKAKAKSPLSSPPPTNKPTKNKKKCVRRESNPGPIEVVSHSLMKKRDRWQRWILPLNHKRALMIGYLMHDVEISKYISPRTYLSLSGTREMKRFVCLWGGGEG